MATLNENLRTFLLNIPELVAIVGTKVYEQHVPQRDDTTLTPDVPFVWFAQAGTDYVRTTNDPVGSPPFWVTFDIECVSDQIAQAINMANIIRAHSESYRGTFGDQTIQLLQVDDQDDNYVFRNPSADSGLSISSLSTTIIP